MNISLDEKYRLIKQEIIKYKSKNPIEIITEIMKLDFINMHGVEHHFLDGACFLVSYYNCLNDQDKDKFELNKKLDLLMDRAVKMPGAMCGYWGVCGSTTSLGASLAIINETSPLSYSSFYSDNLDYTSATLKKMSYIGGPRCCKRNAYISILTAIDFVNYKYNIGMEKTDIICSFSQNNPTCIGKRCFFFKQK